jgi:hypothetical protein
MKVHPKPTDQDHIASAEAACRKAREAHAALLTRLAKLDVEIMQLDTARREQTATPMELEGAPRRLFNVERILAEMRAEERLLTKGDPLTKTPGLIPAALERVRMAEAHLRQLNNTTTATRVQEMVPALREFGPRIQTVVTELVGLAEGVRAKMSELRSASSVEMLNAAGEVVERSAVVPDSTVLQVMENALIAALASGPFRGALTAPSVSRTTFSGAVDAWARAIEGWCRKCLATTPEKPEVDHHAAAMATLYDRISRPYKPPPGDPSYRHWGQV